MNQHVPVIGNGFHKWVGVSYFGILVKYVETDTQAYFDRFI